MEFCLYEGIAGLAAALKFCQAGHRVHILEKAPGPNRVSHILRHPRSGGKR